MVSNYQKRPDSEWRQVAFAILACLVGAHIFLTLFPEPVDSLWIPWIRSRYLTIAYVILYLIIFCSLAYEARACLRLASNREQNAKISYTLMWPVGLTFFAFSHFVESIHTNTSYSIHFLADFGPLFAYFSLLAVIRSLLETTVPKPSDEADVELDVDHPSWKLS